MEKEGTDKEKSGKEAGAFEMVGYGRVVEGAEKGSH